MKKAVSYNCDDTTDVPYITDANVVEKLMKSDLVGTKEFLQMEKSLLHNCLNSVQFVTIINQY